VSSKYTKWNEGNEFAGHAPKTVI